MESEVSRLVDEFEDGRISRRGLITGLTALAAGAAATGARAQETPFEPVAIDHVSVQVEDLAPSIAFYRDIFGLAVVNEDEANKIVRMGVPGGGGPFGGTILVSLHEKAPTGIVDHFAITIRDFDQQQLTTVLAEHGLEVQNNLDQGFHVRDPAGIAVQIMGA